RGRARPTPSDATKRKRIRNSSTPEGNPEPPAAPAPGRTGWLIHFSTRDLHSCWWIYPHGSAMAAPQATLLIVDDEELNREGLARRLQRHNYEVTAAKSGREAIELLGGRPFDLVLLDIMMPGMNGLEVLKFLRRVDSLIDLPIIMVTAK